MEAAKLKDLLGCQNPRSPWKERLPRLIFVSDMGDALSAKADFPFLKSDLMPAIHSEDGMRHLWLWLTKRPGTMAKFAEEIDGFPPNVCAMTTLTVPDEETLARLADLEKGEGSHPRLVDRALVGAHPALQAQPQGHRLGDYRRRIRPLPNHKSGRC